jgi:hypothetical protein
MFTLARLPSTLTTLNFSTITPKERENAELYYLSKIAKEISSVDEKNAGIVLDRHPRYSELCRIYGEPSIMRKSGEEGEKLPPGALAYRLVNVAFYVPSHSKAAGETRNGETDVLLEKQIPRSWDTYRVKGLVYRLFRDRAPSVGLRPMQFRLIWETGEYDPYGGSPEEYLNGDVGGREHGEGKEGEERKGRWVKRETELVDSTRAVGFWFDDGVKDVRVRVEPY